MNFTKVSQSIDTAFEIPEAEKAIAKKMIGRFQALLKQLSGFDSYLDLIYQPFSDNEVISEDSIVKYRGFLIRFKNKALEKFKLIAKTVLSCIKELKHFSSDSHISELMKSLIDTFSDIDEALKEFEKVVSNFKAKDFRNNILSSIQNIKKQKTQAEDLVSDRIITHINTNILASSWVDNLSQEFNLQIPDQKPYLQQLYDEREERLNTVLDNKG